MNDKDFKVGELVQVDDQGLAMLRKLCPDMPPNHHGRVDRVEGSKVWVEFPIDGSYEHSQVVPYDIEKVVKR